MAKRSGSRSSRAELVQRVEMAGRELSTAAVMFHGALAAKHGLGATDEKALDFVERFGPLTAGELGQRAGLAPASVTALLDRLEKKSFVRRVKDPADGRRVLIEIDRASIMSKLAPLFVDFMQRMRELYDGYTVAELETIHHFLTEAARRQRDATAVLAGTPLEERSQDAAPSTTKPESPRDAARAKRPSRPKKAAKRARA